MEVGIVLPPDDGQWLAHIMNDARILAERDDDPDMDMDTISLMGGSPHYSREAGRGGGRDPPRDEDGPSRRGRPRSRSRRGRVRQPSQPPPQRRDQARRHDEASWSPSAALTDHRRHRTGPSSSWTSTCPATTTHQVSGTYRESSFTRTSQSRPSQCPAGRPALDVNEMPLRNGALSLNRLTWRSMLNMGQDPPRTLTTQIMAAPLDSDQLANILQTTARMPPEDKLALMAGFARFVVEMVQQVFQSVMQNQAHPRVDITEEEDMDNFMMMQSGLFIRRHSQMRSMFTLLQGALELHPGRIVYRANALRRRIEERYQGYLQWEHWDGEIQEGHAMLVGIGDCDGPGLLEPEQAEDSQFVNEWWRKLRPLLQSLDKLNTMLAGTVLAPNTEWPEPPATLEDTPMQEADRVLVIEETQAQYEEERARDAAELHHTVEAYLTGKDRSDARNWDDWAMADEMGKASKKARKRLTLEIQPLQPGASSSSTSITLPVSDQAQQVELRLHIKVENNNTDAEGDEAGFGQVRRGLPEHPGVSLLGLLPDLPRHQVFGISRQRARVQRSDLRAITHHAETVGDDKGFVQIRRGPSDGFGFPLLEVPPEQQRRQVLPLLRTKVRDQGSEFRALDYVADAEGDELRFMQTGRTLLAGPDRLRLRVLSDRPPRQDLDGRQHKVRFRWTETQNLRDDLDAVGDETGFVQTRRGLPDGPGAPLLRVLPDQLRNRVLDLLRQRVRVRWSGLQSLLQQMPSQDAVPAIMEPDVLEQTAEYVADIIDPLLGDHDIEVAGPESYTDMELVTTEEHQLPTQGVAGAEGAHVNRTADFVEDKLDAVLMEMGIQCRHQGQRHIVAVLVQLIQGHVAQLRVALALLTRRIPQPRVRAEDQAISTASASELRRLLHALLLQLRPPMPSWPTEEPIDFDAVVPECGPASQLAINIMQFLENGLFDIRDDISDTTLGNDDTVEPHMTGGPGTTNIAIVENQMMLPPHAPQLSSAAMSSSANPVLPARTRQQDRPEVRPLPLHPGHCEGREMTTGARGIASPTTTTNNDIEGDAAVDDRGRVSPGERVDASESSRTRVRTSSTTPTKRARTSTSTTLPGQTRLTFHGDD